MKHVTALLERAGLSTAFTLSPVKGGGNNRVWKLKRKEGSLLLKQYFHHPGDPRDRFGAERSFYKFLQAQGIDRVPTPIAWDAANRLALFEYIEGRKLLPGGINRKRVDEALEFYRLLNHHKEASSGRSLASASEACFSIAKHLDCIEVRVRRLEQIHPSSKMEGDVARFVARQLKPSWERICDTIWGGERAMDCKHDALLPANARRISPSDFGFHNAIVARDGRLRFFDFEYAGWDDPAKTVCDFFCQRAVPVPFRFWKVFLDVLARGDPFLKKRACLLLPAYRIKWCCIMLNEFVTVSRVRRQFAGSGPIPESRRRAQLVRAQNFLSHPKKP